MLQTVASIDGPRGSDVLINCVVIVYSCTALKYALGLLNRLLWMHAENTANLAVCCLYVSEVRVGYREAGRTCTVGNVNYKDLNNVILEAGP
jgi:hypothetical protein